MIMSWMFICWYMIKRLLIFPGNCMMMLMTICLIMVLSLRVVMEISVMKLNRDLFHIMNMSF